MKQTPCWKLDGLEYTSNIFGEKLTFKVTKFSVKQVVPHFAQNISVLKQNKQEPL